MYGTNLFSNLCYTYTCIADAFHTFILSLENISASDLLLRNNISHLQMKSWGKGPICSSLVNNIKIFWSQNWYFHGK